ncbi:MAG: flagellar biosynthesis regulator FlaF [Rhizobiales bacterium]|nr:flagellar biosynthesis regulator FlaF [Hyphomicrobiales bacterium]
MQNAAKAYGTVARQIASPRELEADLLLKAASQLQAVHDSWGSDKAHLNKALRYNRKLWSIFITSVTDKENPLPAEIRQNVANLGIYVINRTMSMLTDPKRDELGSLININRELAAGLRSRA